MQHEKIENAAINNRECSNKCLEMKAIEKSKCNNSFREMQQEIIENAAINIRKCSSQLIIWSAAI